MSSDLHELVAPYALDALDEDERERFERHLADCDQAAKLLAEKPSVKALSGADGSLLVAASGRAALVVCGLQRAPSEKTYEAWVVVGTTPQPAGLFHGGGTCAPVLLSRTVPR